MVTFSKHDLAAALVKWLEHNSHESSPNGPFLKFVLLCTERGVTPCQYVHTDASNGETHADDDWRIFHEFSNLNLLQRLGKEESRL